MLHLILSSLAFLGVFGTKKLSTSGTLNIGQPESCEYDSTNDRWYFGNQINNTIQTYSASGVRDTTKTFSDSKLNGPAGMVVNGNYLYVASFTSGYVLEFNITNTSLIRSFYISGHNPNGLCLDTTNNILYVTDAGLNVNTFDAPNDLQGMWSINLTNGSVNNIFDSTEDYYPNGCAVKSDGTIYVVQTNVDTVGNNQILIINSTTWDINVASGVLGNWNTSADGIVFDNNGNIYVSSWGNSSTGGGYIKVYDGSSWSYAVTDLSGPADIGYDSENDRICIPNYLSGVGLVTDITDGSSSSAFIWNTYSSLLLIICALFYYIY